MKSTVFDVLSPSPAQALDRRAFVKFGAAGLGALASASSLLAFPRRTYLPPTPPPPAEVPLATLTFEVASGVHPHIMLAMLQDYVARTLTPDFAGQVVQAQFVQRTPAAFHQQYWSDYTFRGQIPPTRSPYGYWTGVDGFARSDSLEAIRIYKDMNYFEMRRVLNPSEIQQFGMVLHPCSYRLPPTPADFQNYVRVAQRYYGIPNPEAFTLLYTRRFNDGQNAHMGYLIARGPDPIRSPYKDVLIDNLPL